MIKYLSLWDFFTDELNATKSGARQTAQWKVAKTGDVPKPPLEITLCLKDNSTNSCTTKSILAG